MAKVQHEQDRLRKTKPIFVKCRRSYRDIGDLLPVLLDTGRPQPGKAMLIDGKLPGKEFVHRQRVAAARLLKGEQAAANCGNDFGLTADNPPFGPGRGQIRNC